MLRTAVLKLPPDLRIAFAHNFLRSYRGQNSAVKYANIFWLPEYTRNNVHNTPSLQRRYATVHADGTTEIWSQYGKEPSSYSVTEAKDQQDATPKTPVVSQGSVSKSSEMRQLLALLENKLRAHGQGSATREHVRRALETENPIVALRNLASKPVKNWEGDKATVLGNGSAPVKSGSKSKRNANQTNVLRRLARRASLKQEAGPTKLTGAEEKSSGKDVTEQMPEKNSNDSVQLLNLDFIQANMPLPAGGDMPEKFWDEPLSTSSAKLIHNACQKSKRSMQNEVEFTTKKVASAGSPSNDQLKVYVCQLGLNIPGFYQDTAIGEGMSKTRAKQAAWLHMMSKMHVAGALTKLYFPKSTLQPVVGLSELEATEEALETADIDEHTLKEEKDAKTDIYNYAASLGLVPRFEWNVRQSRSPRARVAGKRKTLIYQMIIRLEAQGIEVSAFGKDFETAEIAAAIAFKKAAEEKHETADGVNSLPRQPLFSVLNVNTAKQFFEFYKDRKTGVNIEVEYEIAEGKQTYNLATLTVDNIEVGETATMRTKAQAESVAYLTAAVSIASEDPHLLEDFADKLKKGKGKVLRPLSPVDLDIDYETLDCMRTTLIEARRAGLPHSSPVLDAERPLNGDVPRHITWSLSPKAHEIVSQDLLAAQQRFLGNPKLEDLRSTKAALPINQYTDAVLEMVQQNQYSIIIGATGSGKTTQVPQFLFEHAIKSGHGSKCHVVCTQPRRIAATSVAQRVAVERDERLGQTVGYHVRADANLPQEPYGITYCTTGILLEKLKSDPDGTLDTVSHIVIDEVHERDLGTDFLMVVLKRAVKIRQEERRPVPRVIFMSATIDARMIAEYFSTVNSAGFAETCPALNVPGRTYPVKEKYLGSIMDELLTTHGPHVKALLDKDIKSSEYLKTETNFSANRTETDSNAARTVPVIDWKRARQAADVSEDSLALRAEAEESLVPISLIATTIAHICSTSSDGAILTFLPGLDEILDVQKLLVAEQPLGIDFSDQSKFQICLLHSAIPKHQQLEIFQKSPVGCRKIILSTNIAETSVTVPEVRYVVDSGKLRERTYDEIRRITKLKCVWVSKSNSKQRAGRAGRVQDGFYYALFSRERSIALRAVGLPDIQRSDLQATCLSIKAQNFGQPVASFLAQAIEPPSEQAVRAAIQNLIAMGAFTPEEDLTALGRVLSKLPVHPALAKMIILGLLFRCLDPMVLLGSREEARSIFLLPVDSRQDAARAHHAYGGDNQSDHIAFLEAFNDLRRTRDESGLGAMETKARQNFLHTGAFRNIEQTAKQIEEAMERSGLITRKRAQTLEFGPPELNQNAKNYELVRALLVAGLSPNLAMKSSSNGLAYRTAGENSVLLHPASLNGEVKSRDTRHDYGTLFTYSQLSRSLDGTTLYARESTKVSPLMAVLFGGRIRMVGDRRFETDEWLPLYVTGADSPLSTRLVLEFRKALDRVLNSTFDSISNLGETGPGNLLSDSMREKFIGSVVDVLNYESAKFSRSALSQTV